MFSIAFAQTGAAAPGPGGGLMGFLPIILIFGVFYFLLIRPQQKKAKEHQEFLQSLKKGDNVVSTGGIHGVITGLTDTVVTVEIAENVRVKISRSHILGKPGSAAEQEGAKTSS